MKRIGLALSALLTITAAASSAGAQEANGMGTAGQLILSADRLVPVFGYNNTSITSHPNDNVTVTNSTSSSSISLLFGSDSSVPVNVHTIPRVAVDYAVIDHLTVGGSVAIGFGLGGSNEVETSTNGQTASGSNDSPTTTVIGLGPRVGYILPLGDLLAFWPRGGLSFYSISSSSTEQNGNNNGTTEVSDSFTLLSLDVDPQLCIVPLPNFFLNVGPLLNVPITGSQTHETTTGGTTRSTSNDFSQFHVGLSAGLGGWFDL